VAGIYYQHVFKRFGDVTVLNDFNLGVKDGTFLALLGPSGSGKSTALRLLAGLDETTKGDIYIGDRVVTQLAPRDRDIAMVFQSYALYPHMSVYDNVAFGLQIRKTPKGEIGRRVDDAARILGIESLLDRKPGQLSGGQRQRVALARAIVREPSVFLLDEPLSNLDAKLRVHTRTEISQLHDRLGTTFVYVTHDQVEAMTMAEQIAVLDQGVIQQVGTPHDLYNCPANRFVGGFIGSPAMNFFDVLVKANEVDLRIDSGSFQLPVPDSTVGSLRPYIGQRVTLGIRPEHIHAQDFTPPGISGAPLRARVSVTEWLGNELFLYLSSGSSAFAARVDPRTQARPREELNLVVDINNLHFFDAESEKSIPGIAV
jgi:multiple sugar transport system ATP-binding protein